MEYLNAFLCGGVLCAVGQVLIDRTRLTPARILTGYVVAGVLLQAVGSLSAPGELGRGRSHGAPDGLRLLPGQGRAEGRGGAGAAGGPTGGLTAAAGGIAAAVVFGVLAALLFRPGDKR